MSSFTRVAIRDYLDRLTLGQKEHIVKTLGISKLVRTEAYHVYRV
ncbi:MAG: hypothetical protein WBB19_04170 [Desulforhopalus sp.]